MPDLGERANVMGPQPIMRRTPVPSAMITAAERVLELLATCKPMELAALAMPQSESNVADIAATVRPGTYDHHEILATARALCDCPDAPWEFQLDMGRRVWDESRHLEIFTKLLEYVGSSLGEFPESEGLWSCPQADAPAARVAGINRGLEGLACDVFEQ